MTPDSAPFAVYCAHVVAGFAAFAVLLLVCAVAWHTCETRWARRRARQRDGRRG